MQHDVVVTEQYGSVRKHGLARHGLRIPFWWLLNFRIFGGSNHTSNIFTCWHLALRTYLSTFFRFGTKFDLIIEHSTGLYRAMSTVFVLEVSKFSKIVSISAGTGCKSGQRKIHLSKIAHKIARVVVDGALPGMKTYLR